MLHVELYADGAQKASNTWGKDYPMLIDPTELLLEAAENGYNRLDEEV